MKNAPISIDDFKNSACAHLNPHLFTPVDKEAKKKKRSKYNNEKIEFDNEIFDSKKELDRYIVLRMLQTSHEIKDLKCHVNFDLESNDTRIAYYEADFVYIILKSGAQVVEDVKSPATRKLSTYRLKNKMMLEQYGVTIKEV